jgi:hypothetical protein
MIFFLQDSQHVSWNWVYFVVIQIWKLIIFTKPNQIDHVNTFSIYLKKLFNVISSSPRKFLRITRFQNHKTWKCFNFKSDILKSWDFGHLIVVFMKSHSVYYMENNASHSSLGHNEICVNPWPNFCSKKCI